MTTPAFDLHDWQTACRARGGQPTVDPVSGKDACRLPVTGNGAKWRYEPANKSISDLLHDWFNNANDALDEAAQSAVEGYDAGQAAVDATEHRLTDIVKDAIAAPRKIVEGALGLPHWLFLVLSLLALYAVGVGVGILPPIKKLVS